MSDKRLIDANALLDQNNWTIKQYSEEEADAWRDGIALMKKNIENAPTIDPETLRPTAHIVHGTVPETEDGVFCSRCRGFIGMETSYIAEHAAFCWHCGAKMEE